jgi:hypothetical protein
VEVAPLEGLLAMTTDHKSRTIAHFSKHMTDQMVADFRAAIDRIISKWTQEEWETISQLIIALMNVYSEVPPEIKSKLAGSLEGAIFSAEYGLFLGVWSQFELTIETLLMREWPAPGSADTELGVLMEPEVGHGETEVYARVQA